ncbi:MAG: histidine phosphatase family protein [Planctomycetaceae bacterium]
MKTLMLMRHSHAVSNNPAYSDHDRPLTTAGRTLAESTATLLKSEGLVPDCIVCSSAARTVETAQLVASTTGSPAEPHCTQTLYLAKAQAYPTAVRQSAKSTDNVVLALGHNPGVASLVNAWSDEFLSFTPASVAIFSLCIDDWSQLAEGLSEPPVLKGFITEGRRQI